MDGLFGRVVQALALFVLVGFVGCGDEAEELGGDEAPAAGARGTKVAGAPKVDALGSGRHCSVHQQPACPFGGFREQVAHHGLVERSAWRRELQRGFGQGLHRANRLRNS